MKFSAYLLFVANWIIMHESWFKSCYFIFKELNAGDLRSWIILPDCTFVCTWVLRFSWYFTWRLSIEYVYSKQQNFHSLLSFYMTLYYFYWMVAVIKEGSHRNLWPFILAILSIWYIQDMYAVEIRSKKPVQEVFF